MGSKLNNGYIGSNELEYVNTRGYSETDGKGILSGTKNYLEEEKKVWRHETNWVRNPQWLEMPEIPEGEQKVVALFAVRPNAGDETNTIAINARNAYTVDWGDGTVTNYTSATTNTHTYDFNSIDASTETDLGYRQVLITITPQAGNNLERVYFNVTYDPDGVRTEHGKDYLDVVGRTPNVPPQYFVIPNSPLLQRVVIHELLNSGTCANMFNGRRALRYVELPYDLSNITSTYYMFQSCVELKYPPYFNTSGVTEFRGMFNNCDSLKRIPTYDYSSATTVRQMFQGCRDLRYVPDMNITSSCTDASYMFENCNSLRECPNLGDISSVTNTTNMFYNCFVIKEIPELVLTSCTNAYNMFWSCINLEKANTITFNSATNVTLTNLFYQCEKLQTADVQGTQSCTGMREVFRSCTRLRGATIDTSSLVDAYRMFRFCNNLQSLPTGFNLSSATNCDRVFEECQEITEFNNIDFSSATNMSLTFYNMNRIRKVSGITGPSITHDWSYRPLEPDSIRNIFNGLPTVSGQTINMYRTPGILSGGVTAGDIAIATGKGWSVTT